MLVGADDKKDRRSSNNAVSMNLSEFNKDKKSDLQRNRNSFENRFQEEIKSNTELDLDVYKQQKSYQSMMMKDKE